MFNFDRLRALAKKQGMTITHLCNIVGKKNSYIADSQNKGIAIPLDAVETWASALHTTPAYLLGETDDPSEGPFTIFVFIFLEFSFDNSLVE